MGAYFPVLWGHAWSLSVEEHFYLTLPIALLLCRRVKNFTWIPWAMPILATVCLFLRYRYALSHSVEYGVTETHLRTDSLFAGVTLGWFQHFKPNKLQVRHSWVIGLSGLLALIPAVLKLKPALFASVGILSMMLGFSLILVWALNNAWLGNLSALAKTGFYSYSIYLWHWPIALIFEGTLPATFLTFWLYVGTCLGVGVLMAKLVEERFLRWRDRLFPSVKLGTDLFACHAPCRSFLSSNYVVRVRTFVFFIFLTFSKLKACPAMTTNA